MSFSTLRWGACLAPVWLLLGAPPLTAFGGTLAPPPSFDGVLLGSSVTAAELASMPQRFACRPQDPARRYQICVQVGATDPNNTSVMLLDGRIEGILRGFTADEADAETLRAIVTLGAPTLRDMKEGRLDLQWKEYGSTFVRLVTQMPEMNLGGALLIMSSSLQRYQDENPDNESPAPATWQPEEMTSSKCLAVPYLCPNV